MLTSTAIQKKHEKSNCFPSTCCSNNKTHFLNYIEFGSHGGKSPLQLCPLDETVKIEAKCHSRFGTIKIPSCLNVIFAALQWQWWHLHIRQIFLCRTQNNRQTNKQTNTENCYCSNCLSHLTNYRYVNLAVLQIWNELQWDQKMSLLVHHWKSITDLTSLTCSGNGRKTNKGIPPTLSALKLSA